MAVKTTAPEVYPTRCACEGCQPGANTAPVVLAGVELRLRRLGYSADRAKAALAAIGKAGTAWCCELVRDCDLAAVEEVIPGPGPRVWPPWTDAQVIELGPAAAPIPAAVS